MTEFKAFWQNYANFSDRTTRRGYWMAYLFVLIITLVLIALTFAVGNVLFTVLQLVWSLAIIIPSLAMQIRRLRDIGKRWTWIFINLVPLIGAIWYLVLLCTPSVEADGTPVV